MAVAALCPHPSCSTCCPQGTGYSPKTRQDSELDAVAGRPTTRATPGFAV
jgi:hypothetical protein